MIHLQIKSLFGFLKAHNSLFEATHLESKLKNYIALLAIVLNDKAPGIAKAPQNSSLAIM